MSKLTIGEAAAALHTAPSTIRSWEQRLGYPRPARSTSGRRLYDEHEIAMLADALRRGLSISSAIRQIREETGSHDALLRQALAKVDIAACDALLEAAIGLRGVSRAFDETILPAVEELASIGDPGIVALAVEWTSDRACWSRRQIASAVQADVLLVDGSGEATVTRAAASILQLQLSVRSARTHVLRGLNGADWRAVARRIPLDAVVFVGTPPENALRAAAMVAARIATFRTDDELMHSRLYSLPAQARLAAEELLADRPHDGSPRSAAIGNHRH